MRILLLNQFYPPDTAATGQLLADVAVSLAGDGHDVHVICSAGGYAGGEVTTADGGGDGIRVHRVGATMFGRMGAFGRLSDWGSYHVLATARALALGRFDVCLALTTPPFIGLTGVVLKRLRRTGLVLWSMDVWPEVATALGTLRPEGLLCRGLGRVSRRLYRECDAIVSLGDSMTRLLAERGADREKVCTVHNWVPGEKVEARPWGRSYLPAMGLDGQFVVMYSGNMGMAHEFDTFLEAAARLKEDPSILFLFVGGGRRRGEAEERARRDGLTNVRFEDPVPLDNLSDLLATARVHLLSMHREADGCLVPSKIYGILASGRPCVLVGPRRSDVGRLICDSQAGLVVPRGFGNLLASALRRFRAEPDTAEAMGRYGRSYYERHLGRVRSVARIAGLVAACGGA